MSNDVILPGTGSVVETVDQGGTAVTNALTAIGNAVLHFASTPAFVSKGMGVSDFTTSAAIPSGTIVSAFDGTTVTLSANAVAGVGSGDTIVFTAQRQVVQAAISSSTAAVAVSPAVTAGAYSAGNIMGGIMSFAGLLDAVRFAGILQSITVKFKGTAVTGNVTLSLFKALPSGTYGDKTAGTWAAADMALMIGAYQLNAPASPLGAMTIYNLDGIGKAVQGASQSLYGILTVAGIITPASASDLTVEIAVLPG